MFTGVGSFKILDQCCCCCCCCCATLHTVDESRNTKPRDEESRDVGNDNLRVDDCSIAVNPRKHAHPQFLPISLTKLCTFICL